ncbi:hypothetical protein GCM10023215_29150 [Pseudonocardia yuanmonensis]|uniref:ACT domain-containing protein n=1 Tax=Pseudonocardia yuanmonensis TaxID=1095914 RepID=A0ABP8WIU9_9PSEU
MTAALLPAPATSAQAPDPVSLTVAVTGGLDGVQRVVTLLRGRGYPVRGLTADLDDDTGTLGLTLPLTVEEAELLVARLHRLPAVLRATLT